MEQMEFGPEGVSWRQFVVDSWRYRDLLVNLLLRDIKVRYAQTALGVTWALFQPVAMVALLHLVFAQLVHVETPVPYVVYAGLGWVCWQYFAFVGTQSALVMVNFQHVIKKLWFPRILLPISKALLGFVDFAIGLVLVAILAVALNQGGNWLFLPAVVVLWTLAALGIGLLVASLSVRYRDLHHALPQLFQLGFFLSPVAYSSGLLTTHLPQEVVQWMYLNPALGLLEYSRNWLLDIPLSSHAPISLVSTAVLFILGLWNFKRMERHLADLL